MQNLYNHYNISYIHILQIHQITVLQHLDSTCPCISIALLKKTGPFFFYCNHAGTTSNLADIFGEGNPDILHHTLKTLKNNQSDITFLFLALFLTFTMLIYVSFFTYSTAIISLREKKNNPNYQTVLMEYVTPNTELMSKAVDIMPNTIKGSN